MCWPTELRLSEAAFMGGAGYLLLHKRGKRCLSSTRLAHPRWHPFPSLCCITHQQPPRVMHPKVIVPFQQATKTKNKELTVLIFYSETGVWEFPSQKIELCVFNQGAFRFKAFISLFQQRFCACTAKVVEVTKIIHCIYTYRVFFISELLLQVM